MTHLSPSPLPSELTSIHHLPLELLENIFSYACTDGGHTGRSLSLVSRYFLDVVRPIRYGSVALTSLRQTKLFLTCLKRERARTTVRVRHLFVSTWRDGQEVARVRDGRMPRCNVVRADGSDILVNRPQWCVWMSFQKIMDTELSQLLPSVLKAAADDLATLSIVHSWEFSAIQLPAKLPALREFTFCGPPPTFPGGCVRLCPPPPPCFPALRHLHVVCSNVSIELWVHHSPSMTHLRLSDLSCASSTVVDELWRGLSFVFGCTIAQTQRPLLFTCVRFQPSTFQYNTSVCHLKNFQPHPSIRVEVMRDRCRSNGHWEARIRRDWDEGLGSGPTWWIGSEELEEAEDESDSDSEGGDPGELRGFAHWM
ncbi:hypothetical protein BD309DRAFT_954163 [Dichomitus squalens]|nr:hypothetical protein BD309DRAFT_954163 [Dichomitus squalens]